VSEGRERRQGTKKSSRLGMVCGGPRRAQRCHYVPDHFEGSRGKNQVPGTSKIKIKSA